MLAAGLVEQGMSAGQAALTVLLGNLIVLVPMLLIGHAGARPRRALCGAGPRLVRDDRGAAASAGACHWSACGWYGIQTWIGGMALLTLLGVMLGADLHGTPLPWLDIGLGQLLAFAVFWALQLFFVRKGLTTIRRLETWTALLKILVCVALVWWAIDRAGGVGPIFAAPSAFAPGGARAGQFWLVFWPALTAMIGYWATIALNIPDFTRFARSSEGPDHRPDPRLAADDGADRAGQRDHHLGDGGDLRAGDLGPGRARRHPGRTVRAARPDRHLDRHDLVQHRREPGVLGL